MKLLLLTAFIFLLGGTSRGQGSLSLSAPMILGNVKVKDNWIPSTAPNYKEYRSGSTLGYGIEINYSFRPKSIVRNKNILLDIGAGYFYQRFDVKRPFDYNSRVDIIFYTDHYSYLSYYGNTGMTYEHTLNSGKHFFTYNVSYRVFKSFQQNYTPTRNTGTEGFFTQINRQQIDFGKMLSINVGVNRNISDRFSIGLNLVAPIYVHWRNDRIFNDDPKTLYRSKFSLGTSLSVSYNFKSKQSS